MKSWLALLLAAGLLVCAVLVPGGLLAQRERRLFGAVEARTVVDSRFEASASTLTRRLQLLEQGEGRLGALSFSAGAGVYYDREELEEIFQAEIDTLSRELPGMESFRPEAPELNYYCLIDPSTGGTYFLAKLQDMGGDSILWMDMESGKLVIRECYSVLAGETALRGTVEELERCAIALGRYLGYDLERLDEWTDDGCIATLTNEDGSVIYHLGLSEDGRIYYCLVSAGTADRVEAAAG